MDAMAKEMNLTKEDLLDFIIPDFGFDKMGNLSLDFGPRQFTVSLQSDLTMLIKDSNGNAVEVVSSPLTSKQLMAMYFDKDSHKFVKQVMISELEGELFETSVTKVLEEEWTPLSEAGNLFSPEKYNLKSLDSMDFGGFVQVLKFDEELEIIK